MNYAFMDLETTGADVECDPIIEVGLVVVDDNLAELCAHDWVVKPEQWPDTVNSHVVKMHARNALWRDVLDVGKPLDDVDMLVAHTLDDYTEHGKIALAGSGVAHFDAPLIRRHMPETAKRLTYWTLDVGVVRRFATRILGFPEQPGDHVKSHRALDDARWHVEEARHWRTYLVECECPVNGGDL